MWKRHWKLARDPFLDEQSPFVPIETHQEAVARLVDTIESGRKLAVVREPGGMGKSRVLAQALAETRRPGRRVARLASPADGASLFAALAEGLGGRVPAGAGRSVAWRALAEAVRVCRWQRIQVVLAVDDCQDLVVAEDRRDLERLLHVDPHPATRLTVLQVFRAEDEAPRAAGSWDLAIRLPALTRSECEQYLTTRLAAAGRAEPTFTPRAINRLHVHSRGVPRAVNSLATLALMAGALRGLEMLSPEVVEGVALEGSWSSEAG